MRTKPIKSLPKEVFSSIDNNQQTTRIFKSIQSDNFNNISNNKENRNSHAFITSSYDTTNIKNYQPKAIYKHVEQTFTTNINHDRVLPTIQRPTMGGKTISSIQPPSTKIMSSEELKLLSRRIDPNEPLSSPHSSPTKPPLPNIINKKRQRPILSSPPPPKIQKILNNNEQQQQQFICEPCNKKYKTRNGYQYHTERCKYLSKAIINCICDNSDQSSTMIECIQCNTWLHIKCVSTTNTIDESTFYCPRCNIEGDKHLLHSGKTVKLSELCQAKERGKNLLQSFINTTTTTNEEKPIRNEFNFISLFSDDTLTTYPPVIVEKDDDNNNNDDDDDDDREDIPSLLFSDDLPSSELSLPESDWFHFANFEDDYQEDLLL